MERSFTRGFLSLSLSLTSLVTFSVSLRLKYAIERGWKRYDTYLGLLGFVFHPLTLQILAKVANENMAEVVLVLNSSQ